VSQGQNEQRKGSKGRIGTGVGQDLANPEHPEARVTAQRQRRRMFGTRGGTS
jgi:hypothetical protein